MHDDLGARLTQLSFQGEMAKRSLTDEKSASGNLDRVVEGVRQTAQALDDIVWMTNPRNDTLSRLISHLAQVASELAESADWVLELSLPDSIPSQAVAGQLRHEIVMVFKEALNNASKHSECSRIRLNIHLDSNLLVFEVADDGKGFDVAGSRDRGNGLLQMKTRTERAGGQISWESQRGQGTRVEVKIQLSPPRNEGC